MRMIKPALVLAAALLLTACSGGKVVKTVDNSADYQNARALPPLKKLDQIRSEQTPESDSVVEPKSPPTQLNEPVAQAEPRAERELSAEQEPLAQQEPSAQQEPFVTEQPSVQEDAIAQTDPLSESDLVSGSNATLEPKPGEVSSSEVSPALESAPSSQSRAVANPDYEPTGETVDASETVVAARVEPQNNGTSRLLMDVPFEQAWPYLVENLQTSDITVFTRNKAAGRFAIGCGDIDAAPKVEKRGGWSFLNRKKDQPSEYCALQAIERKGVTSLSVLNRSGREVGAQFSEAIFNRLLNN